MGDGNGHELIGPIPAHLRYQRFRLSTTSGCRRDHCSLKAVNRVEPDPAERVAGEPVQESGEEGPISRGEPRFLAMQLSLEDYDPVAQGEDLGAFGRSEDHRVGGEDQHHRANRRPHNRRINGVRGPNGILVAVSKRPIRRRHSRRTLHHVALR
jgi:hypothetical protein